MHFSFKKLVEDAMNTIIKVSDKKNKSQTGTYNHKVEKLFGGELSVLD